MAGALQHLTFNIGEDRFAATAADVSEVVRRPRVTRVPKGPPSLLGVTSFRGAPTPVISLARLLGRETATGAESRLLLLDCGSPVGLMVDSVGALSTIESAEGEVGARQGFGRLYIEDGAVFRVLDLDGLLRAEFAGLVGTGRTANRSVAPAAGAEGAARDTVDLLGFEVAGQTYALGLGEVTEALALPAQMASVAQSDEALLGVVDMRGRLLPIVSLRRLLGLPDANAASQRVIVVRIGGSQVGLAVDHLRAILRVTPDAIDEAPAVLNRGVGEAQVGAIARLPDNGGLVAILSAERLFREAKVAHILADGRADNEDTAMAADDAEDRTPFLIFRLGEEEYGLPLSAVDEIVRAPDQLTRLPKAPAFIAGVLNLRGKVIPVIDQRERFDVRGAPAAARPRIIVTTMDGRQAGFIVDAVAEILPLAQAQIGETPELAADAGKLFSRVANLEEGQRLVLLVEPKELLDRAERDLLAAFASTADAAGA